MWRRRLVYGAAVGGAVMASAVVGLAGASADRPLDATPISNSALPPRKDLLKNLKKTEYDVLVIGGGATGSGIALDAATRGMSVALVERDDFSAGTSSRSSKLIHGGVRYLEKAFTQLDMTQFGLVTDALKERRHLLHIAPHLSRPLPIILPLYHSYPSILFYAPYYWAGVKVYDLVAGRDGLLQPSYFISRREALEKFPMLQDKGLKCGIVYYDGQHDDARMNLGIALTAISQGAHAVNHVEVQSLTKDGQGRVSGAVVRDTLTSETWSIRARNVVNATGPFCDSIRRMADEKVPDLICPSAGVHVTLPDRYSPSGMGLIVPKTTDGRVLFLLPWEGSTIAGTTDSKSDVEALPQPTEKDVQFILDEASKYLSTPAKRSDVDSAWSGIRPLAMLPSSSAENTQAVARDHVVEVHPRNGLISIAGGKWTTYRRMAEDVVDRITADKGPCRTTEMLLLGAHGWSLAIPTRIVRLGYADDVAEHLSISYGDKAEELAMTALQTHLDKRLCTGYAFVEAEIVYAAQHEYAETAVDVLARRTRLAFLNTESALEALPRVVQLMGDTLEWAPHTRVAEYQEARKFLASMKPADKATTPSSLTSRRTLARLLNEKQVAAVMDTDAEAGLGVSLSLSRAQVGVAKEVLNSVKDSRPIDHVDVAFALTIATQTPKK